MTLAEIRREIDAIDPQIKKLLMDRLDCSRMVAQAKKESGDLTIFRADREEELLRRYRVQLSLYASALTRLTGKTVRETYIYSVALGKSIPVSL